MPKNEPEKRDDRVEVDPPTKDKMLYMEKQRKRFIEDWLHEKLVDAINLNKLSGREDFDDLGMKKYWEENKKELEEIKELQKFIDEKDKTMDVVFGIFHNSLKIEEELNKFILKKYIKEDMSEKFLSNILLHEGFSVSFKVNILNQSNILKEFGYEKANRDLKRLFELRNIVAHGLRDYKTGSTYLKLKKSKEQSLKTLLDEFNKLYLNLSFVFLRITHFNENKKFGLFHEDFKEDYLKWAKLYQNAFEV
jgi:hypothetical protein